MIANLLALFNVLLAGLLAFHSWNFRTRNTCPMWLTVARMITGIYWSGLYIFVLFADPANYSQVLFGQIFVRPAFTVTLGLMAIGAVWRDRSDDR